MVKPSFVKQFIDTVKESDLARAHKVFDFQTRKHFYQVESSDFANNLTEYNVRYSKEHGFTCDCPSGEKGFYNTRHGFCSHVLIAVAHAAEEKAREELRLAKSTAIALARSCGLEICSTEDCIQLASTTTGKCTKHNGVVTDPGMLAFMDARKRGEDLHAGKPAWMFR